MGAPDNQIPKDNFRIPLGPATMIEIDGFRINLQVIGVRELKLAFIPGGPPRNTRSSGSVNGWRATVTRDTFPNSVKSGTVLEITSPDAAGVLNAHVDPYRLSYYKERDDLLRVQLKTWGREDLARRNSRHGPVVQRLLWRGMLMVARARDPVFALPRNEADGPEVAPPVLVDPLTRMEPEARNGCGAGLFRCRVFMFRSLYQDAMDLDLHPEELLRSALVTIGRNGRSLTIHRDPSTQEEIIRQARASGMLAAQVPEEVLRSGSADPRLAALAQPGRARRRM